MKWKATIVILLVIFIAGIGIFFIKRQNNSPLTVIDSFEGKLIKGANATVDYGAGSGNTVKIFFVNKPVYQGKQALKIVYDASVGGYMWVARGYGLTQKNAGQWKISPQKIKWDKYNAFVFYLYGQNSGNKIAIDLIDNGREYWRSLIKDDKVGWKEVVIPFNNFFCRTDWQPDRAVKNKKLDFPIRAFQFEPKTGKGVIFVDKVCLHKKTAKPKGI